MKLTNDRVRVRVPATSANLGPGFDCAGLALDTWDEVELCATASSRTVVDIDGEGADTLPRDDDHLVIQALRHTLDILDAPQVGVRLHARNTIPQSAGLGSSAAAIVAGISLARGLVGIDEMSDEDVLAIATSLEGHPDNVAPAIYGAVTWAWMAETPRAVTMPVPAGLSTTVLIPSVTLATSEARRVLPATVAFDDAAHNCARAGLLALVLAGATEMTALFDATEDRLHQEARRGAMPTTFTLVDYLRQRAIPAVVSGAGPSVLVFADLDESMRRDAVSAGWRVERWGIASQGVSIETQRS